MMLEIVNPFSRVLNVTILWPLGCVGNSSFCNKYLFATASPVSSWEVLNVVSLNVFSSSARPSQN